MTVWSILGKVIGLVPAVVKVVRETSRRNVKGVGDHWHALRHGATRISEESRELLCYHCGLHRIDPEYRKPCAGRKLEKL